LDESDAAPALSTRPSPQSQVLVHTLRFGLRPIRPILLRAHGGMPISVPIGILRAALAGGSRFVPLDRRVRVEPLTKKRSSRSSGSSDPSDDIPPPPIDGEWVRTVDGAGGEAANGTSNGATNGATNGALLYLHGGAYVFCSPRTHRVLTSRLAVDTGLPVLAPKYRLAPEHPFPAALDDALAAYQWLLAQGIPAGRIVVAGDSAGGHLAATLAAELCRTGRPAPAGIVLFSPWADLTCELSLEWDRECRDPYIVPALGRRFGMLYAGEHDFEDPRLALLRCTTTGLPPFLIQAGGADALRSDAEHLADVLTEIGVSCELQIWSGQMHVFQVLHMLLPEARAAMREAGRFVRTVIGAEPASAAA
jgi:monoterpene epsilon-lactone hydrolase